MKEASFQTQSGCVIIIPDTLHKQSAVLERLIDYHGKTETGPIFRKLSYTKFESNSQLDFKICKCTQKNMTEIESFIWDIQPWWLSYLIH